MYVPAFTAIQEHEARALVAQVGSGWLVTNGTDAAPAATLMPLLWEGDTVVAHMAVANPHWRAIAENSPALLIVTGPQAYVSPSWYPSKAEHGRVVPTWNYQAVHLMGTLRVHREPEWLLDVVTRLTDRHESAMVAPWQVSDAPADHIDGLLRAIVGVELSISAVEGKAKLSQNRSAGDQAGVIDGLAAMADPNSIAVADAMRAIGRDHR